MGKYFYLGNHSITMPIQDTRIKDIILMSFSIQLSIIGTAAPDGSLVPLFFVGVLITIVVIIKETARRFAEYSNQ